MNSKQIQKKFVEKLKNNYVNKSNIPNSHDLTSISKHISKFPHNFIKNDVS